MPPSCDYVLFRSALLSSPTLAISTRIGRALLTLPFRKGFGS
jgi:hypothetical protein